MKSNQGSPKDILLEKGIKPSYIRIKILEYLMSNDNHPSVEEIYKDLKKIFPTLSKTTVYLNLNLFSKKNIIKVLNVDNDEQRFDFVKKEHINFFCEKCKKIYDLDLTKLEIQYEASKHQVNELLIYLKGICMECKKNKK